jgi:hypothetical protein
LNPAGVAALIVGAGAATGAVVAVFLKKGA